MRAAGRVLKPCVGGAVFVFVCAQVALDLHVMRKLLELAQAQGHCAMVALLEGRDAAVPAAEESEAGVGLDGGGSAVAAAAAMETVGAATIARRRRSSSSDSEDDG